MLCEFLFCNQVFSVYTPNSNPERNQFLDDVSVSIVPPVSIVLAGDFNTVFNRSLDLRASDLFHASCESSCALNRLLNACSSIDIWRYLHTTPSSYTWTRSNRSFPSRIDSQYFIGGSRLCRPMILLLVLSPIIALWLCMFLFLKFLLMLMEFNVSVLNHSEYISIISKFWSNWRAMQPRFPTLAKWWDKNKSIIKRLSIRYGCDRSFRRSKHRNLLSRLTDHLKCRVDAGSISCLEPYRSTLAEIARVDIEVPRGAQVRACARWVEAGKTSSPFFLLLKKKQTADRFFAKLRAGDGSIVSRTDDLCLTFSSFYAALLLLKLQIPL